MIKTMGTQSLKVTAKGANTVLYAAPVVALAAASTNMPLSDFVILIWNDIIHFGGMTWMLRLAAIFTVIISSMKVSVLKSWIWDRLGALQGWAGPVMGLLVGVVSLGSGGHLTLSGVMAYLAAGAGAPILHEILEMAKSIPTIGPLWVQLIGVIESALGGTSSTPGTVVGSTGLATLEDIVKNVVMGFAVADAWAALVAASGGVLALPIIGPVVSWIFYKIAGVIYGALQKWVNFEIIYFKTAQQKSSYDAAVAAFNKAHASANGDPNEIQKASDAFDDAFADLVHMDTGTDGPKSVGTLKLHASANQERRVLWGQRKRGGYLSALAVAR